MTLAHPIRRTVKNTRTIKKANGGNLEQSPTPTFGEILPDLHFEVVTDPRKPETLRLHACEGSRFATSSRIEHEGKVYVPANITQGLAQAVRFPSASAEFGSPGKLIGSMTEFFCGFGKTPKEDSDLLAAFALSTWFVDCFRVAPVLHLTGSFARVHLISRLLACMCRRPILLGRLDLSALSTLPRGLKATLLVHEEKPSKNVVRTLDASRNRGLNIPFGRKLIHGYGAQILFSQPASVNASDLRIHLASTAGALSDLNGNNEKTTAADFQAKLLRYRLTYFNKVQDADVDCLDFDPAMHDNVRALLSPLVDCGDFRETVLPSLRSRSKECAGARFTELECLVVEAALCFCHDPGKEKFLVKEITDVVNALLVGRHEDREVNSKTVGTALRGLGLFAERVTKGFRVALTNDNSERIHRLAREYNVPSIDGGPRCDQCEHTDATPS